MIDKDKEDFMNSVYASVEQMLPEGSVFVVVCRVPGIKEGLIMGNPTPQQSQQFGKILLSTPLDLKIGECQTVDTRDGHHKGSA